MTKGDKRPESVEDDGRLDDAIVVELSEVLDSRDPLLVVLEAIDLHSTGRQRPCRFWSRAWTYLHAYSDVLEDFVDDSNLELGMIPPEIVQQDSEQVYVAVLDLPHLGERTMQLTHDLRVEESQCRMSEGEWGTCGRIFPVQLASELEDLVARVAHEDVVEEVVDVELHGRAFLRRDRRSVRRIALERCMSS
jgi:hypothetical protein